LDRCACRRLAAFNTEAGSEPALKLKLTHWQREDGDWEVRHDVTGDADVPARCARAAHSDSQVNNAREKPVTTRTF